MAGDPSKAAVWQNADVYIGSEDAEIPRDDDDNLTGEEFGSDWDLVGLLDGEEGFTESADMDSDDFYAWGGILVATTRRNFKLTREFTAYEDNETVLDLAYPGHDLEFDENGDYSGKIKSPNLNHKFKIAFETRSQDRMKRVVSTNYAQIDERGDVEETEEDLASRSFTVVIYPDKDGNLFDTFKGDIPEDYEEPGESDGEGN